MDPKRLNLDSEMEVDLRESDSEELGMDEIPASQPRSAMDSVVVGESEAQHGQHTAEEVPAPSAGAHPSAPLVPSTVLGAEPKDPNMSAERVAGLKRQLAEVKDAEKQAAKQNKDKEKGKRTTAAKGKAASKAKAKAKQSKEKQEDAEDHNSLEPEEPDSSEEQPSPSDEIVDEAKPKASFAFSGTLSLCL